MLKLSGIILIFVFCVMYSYVLANALSEEYNRLVLLCDMIFDIKSYISFESMTLKEISIQLSQNASYERLGFLYVEKNCPDVKKRIMENIISSPPFKDHEINNRLIRLFNMLGESDKKNQLDLLDGAYKYFEGQAHKLYTQLPVKKRLYRSLGAAAGAIAAVMLI